MCMRGSVNNCVDMYVGVQVYERESVCRCLYMFYREYMSVFTYTLSSLSYT